MVHGEGLRRELEELSAMHMARMPGKIAALALDFSLFPAIK